MKLHIVFGETELVTRSEGVTFGKLPEHFYEFIPMVLTQYPNTVYPVLDKHVTSGSSVVIPYELWERFCKEFQYPDFVAISHEYVPIALQTNNTFPHAGLVPERRRSESIELLQFLSWYTWWFVWVRENCERPSVAFHLYEE